MLTLDEIALKHGTDKSSAHHGYTKYYEQFFAPLRDLPITFVECGYGGYQYPDRGGAGARTWREYFTKATIISTDIYPKVNVPEGVHFYEGSQTEGEMWRKIFEVHGRPSIFIDDASHINHLSIKTFRKVFPHLLPGGIYVWEDLESSWWEDPASDGQKFYGRKDPTDFQFHTAINFLRRLINDVNAKHIADWVKEYDVESISFFQNIAFIVKK
jgi:hypothetical protein